MHWFYIYLLKEMQVHLTTVPNIVSLLHLGMLRDLIFLSKTNKTFDLHFSQAILWLELQVISILCVK